MCKLALEVLYDFVLGQVNVFLQSQCLWQDKLTADTSAVTNTVNSGSDNTRLNLHSYC